MMQVESFYGDSKVSGDQRHRRPRAKGIFYLFVQSRRYSIKRTGNLVSVLHVYVIETGVDELVWRVGRSLWRVLSLRGM